MLLQEFLKNNSVSDLETQYAIVAKRHTIYPNLILFKYNQIESPMGEAIVQECRGVILDEAQNWKIISRPFDKFFNHGEGHAAPIDWQSARVQEKVDGSLAILYVYNGMWHVSTSGTPDAIGQVNDYQFSFKDLFWKTFGNVNQLPPVDCNKCFIFELTTPFNKVVIHHKDSYVTLLGARDIITQQELTGEEALKYFNSPSFTIVKEYKLSSFDDIIKSFEHMSGLSQEGYVVVDKNFHRQKVKHPQYVALHHMKDGLGSKKSLVEVVRAGEISEVISVFPEYEEPLNQILKDYNSLISELENIYNEIKNIESQKEFAWEACKTRCSSALFAVRAKKTANLQSFFKEMHIDSLMRLLKYKI